MMKPNSAKKVVIIHDIQSDSIEQAIFILRSSGRIQTAVPNGAHIVEEAQRIIHAYSKTVERANRGAEKKHSTKRRMLYAVLAMLLFLGASYMLYRFGDMVMVGFSI